MNKMFEKDMQAIEEAAKEGQALIYTLVDEEGHEEEFELLAACRRDGVKYYALIPANLSEDAETIDFVILKGVTVDGAEDLVSIEDEEEEADVADYFNDLLTEFYSEEVDYDEK